MGPPGFESLLFVRWRELKVLGKVLLLWVGASAIQKGRLDLFHVQEQRLRPFFADGTAIVENAPACCRCSRLNLCYRLNVLEVPVSESRDPRAKI